MKPNRINFAACKMCEETIPREEWAERRGYLIEMTSPYGSKISFALCHECADKLVDFLSNKEV